MLIGSGELEQPVDAAVIDAGLQERFTRIPSLPGAAGVLGQLDVFALSSRFEGGPYAPLEAMRAETPVVLTEVVGSRDTVEDGVSGLVVPPADVHALADAVVVAPPRPGPPGPDGTSRPGSAWCRSSTSGRWARRSTSCTGVCATAAPVADPIPPVPPVSGRRSPPDGEPVVLK